MASVQNLLICGSNGQLGREFQHILTQREIPYFAPKEEECNITNFEQTRTIVEHLRPRIVINCAAYNAVDDAEETPGDAQLVNHLAVKNLAEICREKQIRLVHYSTDYVFDGTKNDVYIESDTPNPLGEYGKSKLEGEMAVQSSGAEYLVFRLSWVFGDGTQNFLHKLKHWASKNLILKVSNDEVSVPTYTVDVVSATLSALEKGLHGLYHLTNTGYASRFEFAKYFIEQKKLTNLVTPVPMSHFPTKARRPRFSAMSNSALSAAARIEIPTWQDAVKRYCENY